MRVAVQLFAIAAQRVGQRNVVLELPALATVGDVRRVLAANNPLLAALVPGVLISVQTNRAANEDLLPAGAEVTVIPPLAAARPLY